MRHRVGVDAAGFGAVENLFPYDFEMAKISRLLQENQLVQALFNLPPRNWQAGERGLAALSDRKSDFRDSVATALRYAAATGVGRVHVMSGIARQDDQPIEQRDQPGNGMYHRNLG